MSIHDSGPASPPAVAISSAAAFSTRFPFVSFSAFTFSASTFSASSFTHTAQSLHTNFVPRHLSQSNPPISTPSRLVTRNQSATIPSLTPPPKPRNPTNTAHELTAQPQTPPYTPHNPPPSSRQHTNAHTPPRPPDPLSSPSCSTRCPPRTPRRGGSGLRRAGRGLRGSGRESRGAVGGV